MKIKKTIFILLLIILLMSTFSLAETSAITNHNEGKELCNYLIEEGESYTKYEIPSFLPYKNEVMNGYTTSGELVGHLKLENRKITEYNCEEAKNPTYNITIKNKQTITDIINANSSLRELSNKIDNKEIDIRGTSTRKKLKGFFTKVSLKVIKFFI